jgi:hypothetical protein
MKSIELETMLHTEFVEKLKAALAGREIAKIVSFRTAPEEITVIFSKLGTTEIKYQVVSKASGFVATLATEKVALAHRPFKSEIQAKLVSAMQKIGAKVT